MEHRTNNWEKLIKTRSNHKFFYSDPLNTVLGLRFSQR
jgi:hypothetical protein